MPQMLCRREHGCECEGCVDDSRRQWREYKQQRLGFEGRGLAGCEATRAQLKMLREVHGFRYADIAAFVGCDRRALESIGRGERSRASGRVRARVDRLWRDQMEAAA